MKLKQKGFTLVELLITIAIIALLIGVVLAGLSLIRQKGRDASRIADIKQISGAIENYFDTCYEFPEDIYDPSNGLIPDCKGNVYLPEVPKDPRGQEYLYYAETDLSLPARYHLCAELEISFGSNKGKANEPAFSGTNDPCNGTREDGKIFDVVGGALE